MLFYGTIKNGELIPSNKKTWAEYLLSNEGKKMVIDLKRETGVRTGTQNNAIHKYYEVVSTALSEKGLTFDLNLGNKTVKLEWTPNLVKESMWKPIQKALIGKASTTKLDKISEISQVYEHMNRFLSSEPLCIFIPFPTETKDEFDTSGLYENLEVPKGEPKF